MPMVGIQTEERRERLLQVASEGATNRDAAAMTGISESALYKWLREDEEFADAYRSQQATGRFKSIEIIAKSDDWRAHAWLLERVDPENWGKQEITPDSLIRKLDAYREGVEDGRRDTAMVPEATEA